MRKLVLVAALAAAVPVTTLAGPRHGAWHGGFRGAPVAGGWHGGWHGGPAWYGGHRHWGGWSGAVIVGPAYYAAPVYYGWYAPAPVYYPAYAPVVVQERIYETVAPARPAPRGYEERPAPPVARAPSAQSETAQQPQPYSSTTTQRGGNTLPSKADRN